MNNRHKHELSFLVALSALAVIISSACLAVIL